VAAAAWQGAAARWANVDPAIARPAASAVGWAGVTGAGLAGLGILAALAVFRRNAPASRVAVLVAAMAMADLARAAYGTNPQAPAALFDPLPEMKALRLDDLDGGRVFSYGPDQSPAFRRFLGEPTPGRGLWSFFVIRQMLAPYANVLDRVESSEAKDLTSFVPRAPELLPEDYRPENVGAILPRLRNAAVSRIVSLDPLDHPDLRLVATVASGAPGLQILSYEVAGPWPRAYLACRVLAASSALDAFRQPFLAGFDPRQDVALEVAGHAACGTGTVARDPPRPGEERFDVQSDGPGYLVTRDSYARGWTAAVDGTPTPVLRANGKHRAVAVPAGRHVVELRYRPPGLGIGLALMGAAAAAGMALWIRPVRPVEGRG